MLKPLNRQYWLLVAALQLSVVAFAQQTVVYHDTTLYFKEAADTATIHMGGLLDAGNTLTYPNSIGFQHMESVIITNTGSEIVRHPRIVMNSRRNWFDIQSLRSECFADAVTPKEKALAIWKFMRDNRLHYAEPDFGLESDDPIKMLGVYGYGMCYNMSYVTAFITSVPPVLDPYREYSPRNKHSVKDFRFDSTFMLIDPDIEVFYLDYNNEDITIYDRLANDKYLIKRVHHYGKSNTYNFRSTFVADGVYEPSPARYTGYLTNFHSLDFDLRPGESIRYSWSPAKYYHHYAPWTTHNAPLQDIGNGQLIYATNFLNSPLSTLLSDYSNLTTFAIDSISPNLHTEVAYDTAQFIVRVKSPFVIVNSAVIGSFYRPAETDVLQMFFSKDSLTWHKVWEMAETGSISDSISLYENIEPIGTKATYEIYLKFKILSSDPLQYCGIDSLRIVSDFQVNRFFLPALQLGTNSISYSDINESERNIAVKIQWKESSENNPPSAVDTPVFPPDQSQVDSLKFTFSWIPPNDDDEIQDYEFILSDRQDVKYPLSPSFEIYTRACTGSNAPTFSIPHPGMLNASTTYYWKVRAKDARGAWGEWSPVWSFVPMGVMPPIMKRPNISSDTISLEWQKNGKGKEPVYYEIHGSNEAFGFTPDASTLLNTTASTNWKIAVSEEIPKTFYRVIAVDEHGAKSGPSNYETIPYPHVYHSPDTVKPQTDYSISLQTNEVYTTDALEFFFPYIYIPLSIPDPVQINILSKPDWLTYNEADGNLTGKPSYSQTIEDSIVVEFIGKNTGHRNVQVLQLPARSNSNPVMTPSNLVAYTDSTFSATISITDPDLEHGDYFTKVEIIYKPSWLNVVFSEMESSIHLSGRPSTADHGENYFQVQVFDLSSYSLNEFMIDVRVINNEKAAYVCPDSTIRIQVDLPGEAPWDILQLANGDTVFQQSGFSSDHFPLTLSSGVSSYRVIANSKDGLAVDTTVIILVNKSRITGLSQYEATENVSFKSKILTHNPCEGKLTYKLLQGPSWLSVNKNSGELEGRPSSSDVGLTTILVEISDGNGISITRSFFLRIEPLRTSNYAATIWSDVNVVCEGETAYLNIFVSVKNEPWSFKVSNGEDTIQVENITENLYRLPVIPRKETRFELLAVANQNGQSVELAETIVDISIKKHSIRGLTSTIAVVGGQFNASIVLDEVCLTSRFRMIQGPSWIQIDSLTGSIIGGPGKNEIGINNLVVEVVDAYGNQDIDTLSIEVKALSDFIDMRVVNTLVCPTEDVKIAVTFNGTGRWRFTMVNANDTLSVDEPPSSTSIVSLPFQDFKETLFLINLTVDGITHELQMHPGEITRTPVRILGIDNQIALEEFEYVAKCDVINECGTPLQFELLRAPAWLTIDPVSGIITGYPQTGDAGVFDLVLATRDVLGYLDTLHVLLKVLESSADVAGISVRISPNPATTRTTIHYGHSEPADISITIFNPHSENIYTKTIKNSLPGVHTVTWESGGISSGLYFVLLKITDTNGNSCYLTRRIIKL